MRVNKLDKEKLNRVRLAEAKIRMLEQKLFEAELELLEAKDKARLQEFTTEQFYQVLLNKLLKRKISVKERAEIIANEFKNTSQYETKFDKETNSIVRVKTGRTHLQLKNGTFCSKDDFKAEFLKQKFDNQKEANDCLNLLLNMFDSDGWLIIDKK